MIITAVDVGVTNFAFVKCEVEDNEITRVVLAERLDLAVVGACEDPTCSLRIHGKNATSRLLHLDRDRPEILKCDILLVEQQPLVGMKGVEQALCALASTEVKLVSPRSMHHHFGIGRLSYDERKKETTEIASVLLDGFVTPAHPRGWADETRKHDIADAMCIMIFYLHCRRAKAREAQEKRERLEHINTILATRGERDLVDFLAQFKCHR